MTAPIIFVLAGVLLTHGPLAVLSVTPAPELVKGLAEATLVLVFRRLPGGAAGADPDGADSGRAGRGAAGLRRCHLGGLVRPRGLASVVFALLALEEIGQPAASRAVAVIAVTVLLSVVAHGATADPLARRFGPRLAPAAGALTRQHAGCAGAQAHPPGTRRNLRDRRGTGLRLDLGLDDGAGQRTDRSGAACHSRAGCPAWRTCPRVSGGDGLDRQARRGRREDLSLFSAAITTENRDKS